MRAMAFLAAANGRHLEERLMRCSMGLMPPRTRRAAAAMRF